VLIKAFIPVNTRHTFQIDLSEHFPHLARAPIVEAVIHWRARSDKTLQREALLDQLKARLPDYPTVNAQHELQLKATFGPERAAHAQSTQWEGFRLESADSRHIAQFTRNGFVFSRLTPYEDWSRFATEAKRLWRIHVELTEPSEIERLGVRFINRIVPVDLDKLGDVLTLPPRYPGDMDIPFQQFLHQTLFDVAGHPYSINVIQTSQPPTPPDNPLGLIIDIDVFSRTTIDLNDTVVDQRLTEMRCLKNKVFFALITQKALAQFQETA